ncbi:TetR/AcrR family transcriptional regulator [Bacillus sp. CGMCC 1.16607]|uniref:TetR/AcrR family transcriptional regulator n=1 Tax=Bacillus sp. CGMCC 1.16607 TaxID=3351842 RepID=UPI00363C8457
MSAKKSNHSSYGTQETKQLIIHESQRLFMTFGYRSVSTRQIAEACNVTQPALYHHFQNKQLIYIEVVKSIMDRTRADLYFIMKNHTSFKERLFQISFYMLTNHQGDLSQMFHDIQHEMNVETQELFRKWWMDSYLMPIVEIIEEAVTVGQIRDLASINSTVIELAYFLLDMMKSFLQSYTYRTPNEDMKKIEAERKSTLIVTVFIDGLSG